MISSAMSPARRPVHRRTPTPRFEIGDRVLVEGQEGLVSGVRYGAPAYDVRINGVFLRNLAPEMLRLTHGNAGRPSISQRTAA
jgi:hypothetical protein